MFDGRDHILISLEPRHAESIFAGLKKVELRRRVMHVVSGTTAWIYVKLPVGSVIGSVKVGAIHNLSPVTLWRRFGSLSGLTRAEFFEYFKGVSRGTALVIESAELLNQSISLREIRKMAQDFQPPQFFTRLPENHPLLEIVEEFS